MNEWNIKMFRKLLNICVLNSMIIYGENMPGSKRGKKEKVKISLLQAVESHTVARGQGSHIT
jgi:hypothetical protein